MGANDMAREMRRDDLYLYQTIFDIAGPHFKLENIYSIWKELRAKEFWTIADIEVAIFNLS